MSLTLAGTASVFAEDTHTGPGGVRGTAVLSTDLTRRYLLTRRWDDGPLMAWVMLNPSTADARTDDATITRCVRRARNLAAFGGIAVVNLFSLRTPAPASSGAARTLSAGLTTRSSSGPAWPPRW